MRVFIMLQNLFYGEFFPSTGLGYPTGFFSAAKAIHYVSFFAKEKPPRQCEEPEGLRLV